jgi:nucleoside-diphosphate-sugar epimerase
MKTLLVTGSNGLIGSEMVRNFHRLGWKVHGLDNNMPCGLFGPQRDTRWNQERLVREHPNFVQHVFPEIAPSGCVKEEPPGASGFQEYLIVANNKK